MEQKCCLLLFLTNRSSHKIKQCYLAAFKYPIVNRIASLCADLILRVAFLQVSFNTRLLATCWFSDPSHSYFSRQLWASLTTCERTEIRVQQLRDFRCFHLLEKKPMNVRRNAPRPISAYNRSCVKALGVHVVRDVLDWGPSWLGATADTHRAHMHEL